MDKVIVAYQIETIKQQCFAFKKLKWTAHILPDYSKLTPYPVLIISPKGKTYKFSDPDLNVVIGQIASLYKKHKGN